MKNLTIQEMRSVNGGRPARCGDLEGAMMVLAVFGNELGVAVLVGVWIGSGCNKA
jgi:hypothetical protein